MTKGSSIMKRLGSTLFLAAALAASLGGCLSAPAPSDPVSVWSPPSAAQQQADPWPDLRHRQPDAAKVLALPELADIGLRNNPATRKTWNEARAAAAQVEQARGYFMPTITAVGGVTRQHIATQPDTLDQDFTKYNPGLQVNYLILNFGGGRQAAVEAALQTVYAADFAFNQSIQDVLLAVESAYYGVVSAQAGIEAAETNVKEAKTTLEAARERLNAGMGTQLEVLQAQANYDQSLYGLAGAQGQLKIACGLLAQAVGEPADTALQVTAPSMEVPEELSVENMRQLIDAALQRRPDIAALRATAAAREATVTAVGSELWPSLYLTGSASRDYYDVQKESSLPMQDRDWAFVAGLSLQWTLFDGFQTVNAKRVARAQAESAKAQLEQAQLAASADVWTRYNAYETALQKYKFSVAFLQSATASHEAAMESYTAGLKSILDVLNAESQVAQARSQHVAARQEAFTALSALAHATGLLEASGADRAQEVFSSSIKKDNRP